MGVRAYLRSPVALVWTLLGSLAVGLVAAAGLRIGTLAARSPVVADPTILDGLAGFVFTVAFGVALVVLATLVWLPCSLGVAYAVGSRVRGHPVSFGDSVDRIRARAEPLYRWVKTRVGIDPIADRLLTENDVSPAEVAVGCGAFVVPALALDSPTIRTAVGRANRAVPQPGRGRSLAAGLGVAGLLFAGALGAGIIGGSGFPTRPIALGAVIVGLVFTAALDTAWRAGAYASQDLNRGFE